MASHEHDEEHGLAHIASKKILLMVFAVLLFFTILTVMATMVDFGKQTNLVIAMTIATIKATLVAAYFMHLRYDRLFHTVVIASGLLAAVLFVGLAFMDGAQYQRDVCVSRQMNCKLWDKAIDERVLVRPLEPGAVAPPEKKPEPTSPEK